MKAFPTICLLLILYFCGGLRTAMGQSISGVVNTYYSVTAVNTSTNSLVLDNATGLTSGQRVLIMQIKGATISSANNSTYGDITSAGTAGNYEFNTLCSVVGNEVWLQAPLVNTYDPTSQLQMVAVPVYQSVTVSATLSASPWDPVSGKGGILAIEASDTIYLNANADVSGQGFQGGALVNYPIPPFNCSWAVAVNNYFLSLPASGFYSGGKKGEGIAAYILNEEYGMGKLSNGGGGGNNNNTGGAGGGNYGAGGNGGQRAGESFFDCHGQFPGIGGLGLATYGYTPALNRIFLGGGGGSGHENNGVGLPGGNGGGIIFLKASVIVGAGGSLMANGLSPVNPANSDPTQAEGDGGGGGGAGGAVIINAPTINGLLSASANGAGGSNASNGVNDCTGPGGGGGGGVIWSSGAVFPAGISPSVTGGLNGVVSAGSSKASCRGSSNGAAPGSPGTILTGYSAPGSSVNICSVLATPFLQYFSGVLTNQGNQLAWGLYPAGADQRPVSFTLERSLDAVNFLVLANVPALQDTLHYRYTDASSPAGKVYYRLILTDKIGNLFYSPVISLIRQEEAGVGIIGLYPNPANDVLTLTLSSREAGPASLRICNTYGQDLSRLSFTLHTGPNSLNLPVQELAAGVYFLILDARELRQVRSFLKQ